MQKTDAFSCYSKLLLLLPLCFQLVTENRLKMAIHCSYTTTVENNVSHNEICLFRNFLADLLTQTNARNGSKFYYEKRSKPIKKLITLEISQIFAHK